MKTDVNGLNIEYNVYGEGADVVVLHGWGAQIGAVMPIANALSPFFRVWVLDLPGFGKSDKPPENWDVYSYADFAKAFIDKMQIENPVLIGHSFGGRISIILAGKKMTKINKLVLVDSAGVLPKRTASYYTKVYSYKFMKKVAALCGKISKSAENTIKSLFGSADYKNADPVMRTIMVRVVNEDLTYLFGDVAVPALLIWGENDDATPVSDGKLMEKLMPDAGLVVLGGAGHFSYLDKPADFAVIVKKFLEPDMQK